MGWDREEALPYFWAKRIRRNPVVAKLREGIGIQIRSLLFAIKLALPPASLLKAPPVLAKLEKEPKMTPKPMWRQGRAMKDWFADYRGFSARVRVDPETGIQAGAQNLLMTLWPISDEVTVQIMSDFYEAAHNSGNPPEALAEVQRNWLVKLHTEKGLAQAVK